MVRAGELDRQVQIYRASLSETEVGAPTPTWSLHKTLWARRDDISGREFLQMNRESTAQLARFKAWYDSDITTKDILRDNSVDFDIINVRELGRQEGIELLCEARPGLNL